MIRCIQNFFATIPTTGNYLTFTSAVDPAKCILVFMGEGYQFETDTFGEQVYAWAWQLPPVFSDLNSSSVFVTFPMQPKTDVKISLQLIEYI